MKKSLSPSNTAIATMARIVDVAIAQIEECGEPGLRVNDVARSSGVSVATLYHYFRDREGVVVAARLKQLDDHSVCDFESFAAVLDCATSPAEFQERMTACLVAMLTGGTQKSRFIRAEIVGSSRTRPALAAALKERHTHQVEFLEGVFARARERGFVHPELSPLSLAEMAMSLQMGSVVNDLMALDGEGNQAGIARAVGMLVAVPN